MKTLTFYESYFANKDEWENFLSDLDVKEDKDNIREITIKVESYNITDTYFDE